MQSVAIRPLVSALLVCGLLGLSVAPAQAQSSIQTKEIRSAIQLNGQAVGTWTLLDRNGMLYASQEAFEAWQIRRRSRAESISHAGQTWYALASVSGFEASQNFSTQTLRLQFAPQAIIGPPRLPTVTSAAAPPAPPDRALNAPNSIATNPDSTGARGSQSLEPSGQSAAAASVPSPAVPVATPGTAQGGLRILPLEVRVNGAPSGSWPLLEKDGMLHATEDAFEEWRLNRREGAQPVVHRNQNWYALGSVPGYESRLNFADQSIDIVFSANAFAATRLNSDAAPALQLTPSVPAFFFNYDLNLSHSHFPGAGGFSTRELAAVTEAGLSGSWGVLTSSFIGRNLISHDPMFKPHWDRLETTFTRDWPDSKISLRLGDASTRAGAGTRHMFFGGLQIARNFALQPGFVTQPIPVIQGTSSAPSTVELYVNDALRQTSNLPTGPFAIDNFPLLTGGGQVRVVVRDVLGRETVVVQPFFSHADLLEQGLSDWSAEIGAVRENLGTRSNQYGQRFASGLYRYGFSKAATGEISAQLGAQSQTMGLGLTLAVAGQVLGYASLAASHDKSLGRGSEWTLGAEYSYLPHGFSSTISGASRNYRQLGITGFAAPNRLQAAASYSYTTEKLGTLGLGVAKIDNYASGEILTTSANYSMRLGERNNLTLSVTRASGSGVAAPATTLGLSLNIALDQRMNSSSSITRRAGQTDAYTSVSQGPAGEFGTGWRALIGTRNNLGYTEAGFHHQDKKLLLTGDISASSIQHNLRLGLQSGLVFVDGQLFASRRVQDSFAVVEVPGYADIGVGFQGSVQARTDASGRAFLPRLQSFQRNNIRLDPAELPISAEIDNIEQVAVPAARRGVKIVFPVRSGRAALIKIVLADGQDAPAGAEIELVGDKQEFFVARRGEAFITGLQAKNTLRLKHLGKSCDLSVELPPEGKADDILRLGPLRCEGVTR